eukprot:scaffold7052_cov254-Pinguiococcus_pyrenoidosus.AAC.124
MDADAPQADHARAFSALTDAVLRSPGCHSQSGGEDRVEKSRSTSPERRESLLVAEGAAFAMLKGRGVGPVGPHKLSAVPHRRFARR